MISPQELERLMECAKTDAHVEPAFFAALLDARIYAHAPIAVQPGHKGFMSCRDPQDGVTIVAFFTDRHRAQQATQGVARVVTLSGRAFMDATRGSILALNPQDAPSCVLYPEEVAALLDEGYVAEIQTLNSDINTMLVRALDKPPYGLLEIVVGVVRELSYVKTVYLAARASGDAAGPASILIAVGCECKYAERTARALASVLQRQSERFGVLLDVVHIEPGEPPPWIGTLRLEPVYRRSPAMPPGTQSRKREPS